MKKTILIFAFVLLHVFAYGQTYHVTISIKSHSSRTSYYPPSVPDYTYAHVPSYKLQGKSPKQKKIIFARASYENAVDYISRVQEYIDGIKNKSYIGTYTSLLSNIESAKRYIEIYDKIVKQEHDMAYINEVIDTLNVLSKKEENEYWERKRSERIAEEENFRKKELAIF